MTPHQIRGKQKSHQHHINSDNNRHLQSPYYVPSTEQALSHLILTTTLEGKGCYYAHLTDDETEATEFEQLAQSHIARKG